MASLFLFVCLFVCMFVCFWKQQSLKSKIKKKECETWKIFFEKIRNSYWSWCWIWCFRCWLLIIAEKKKFSTIFSTQQKQKFKITFGVGIGAASLQLFNDFVVLTNSIANVVVPGSIFLVFQKKKKTFSFSKHKYNNY